MKKTKRLYIAVSALILMMAFIGCGKKESSKTSGENILGNDQTHIGVGDNDNNDPYSDNDGDDGYGGDDDYGYDDYDGYNDYDDYDDYDAEEAALLARADAVIGNMDIFLTAIKNGDVDTILSYGTDDCDVKKYIEKMEDKETAAKIIRLLYADLEWIYEEECSENLARTLSLKDDGDKMLIGVLRTYHPQIYLEDFYFASLADGTKLPEDYDGGSEDEAEKVAKTMISKTPLFWDSGMFIQEITQDGSFKTDLDSVFGHQNLHWDHFRKTKSERAYRAFVKEVLDLGDDTEFGTDSTYDVYGEELDYLNKLILAKDYKTMAEVYVQETGEDLPGDVSYEDLTPAQQQKADAFIENEVEVFYNKESCWLTQSDKSKLNIKRGSILVVYPVIYDRIQFYGYDQSFIESHDLKKVTVVYDHAIFEQFSVKGQLLALMSDYGSIIKRFSTEE